MTQTGVDRDREWARSMSRAGSGPAVSLPVVSNTRLGGDLTGLARLGAGMPSCGLIVQDANF